MLDLRDFIDPDEGRNAAPDSDTVVSALVDHLRDEHLDDVFGYSQMQWDDCLRDAGDYEGVVTRAVQGRALCRLLGLRVEERRR